MQQSKCVIKRKINTAKLVLFRLIINNVTENNRTDE